MIDDATTPHYYIYTDISDLVFVFGLEIPETFEPAITEFEIWYNGTQIGERTPADEQLRHLALDYQETSMLTVRLYGEDGFLCECEIDTTVPRDVLPVQQEEEPVETAEPQEIGTYQITTSSLGSVSTSTLELTLDSSVGAAYYTLQSENGTSLYTDEPVSVDEPFTYLTLLVGSLDKVSLELYDSSRNSLGTATFVPERQTIEMVLPA